MSPQVLQHITRHLSWLALQMHSKRAEAMDCMMPPGPDVDRHGS